MGYSIQDLTPQRQPAPRVCCVYGWGGGGRGMTLGPEEGVPGHAVGRHVGLRVAQVRLKGTQHRDCIPCVYGGHSHGAV